MTESTEKDENEDVEQTTIDALQSPREGDVNGESIKAVEGDAEGEYFGRLFWYTFGDFLVPKDELEKLYEELEIPEDHWPGPIHEKGAWKRAAKSLESKDKIKVEGDNGSIIERTTEYMTRKLDPDRRHLVKEVRREDKGRLDYSEIVEFEFHNRDKIVYRPLEDSSEVPYSNFKIYQPDQENILALDAIATIIDEKGEENSSLTPGMIVDETLDKHEAIQLTKDELTRYVNGFLNLCVEKELGLKEKDNGTYKKVSSVKKAIANGESPEGEKTPKEWYKIMMSRYERMKNAYTNRKIRDTIREAIQELTPVSMRESGGLYFVPEEYAGLMEKFSRLAIQLNENFSRSSYRTELVQIPVVREPEQKDMIREKVKTDTVKRAGQTLQEAKEIIEQGQEMSPSEYEEMVNELETLNERRKEYEDMLGEQLDTCKSQIEILNQQLEKLAKQVIDE